MMDFAPFFRLAALIVASLELGRENHPAKDDVIMARAERYATFINGAQKP